MSRWLLSCLLVLSGVALSCRDRTYEEVRIDFDAGVAPHRPSPPDAGKAALRFSVAAIQSPVGTWDGYSRLLALLGEQLGVPVQLIQRNTYRETNDLLTHGSIDVAFICTGGYFDLLRSGAKVDVLAVPVVRGTTTYHSVVIVPAASSARRLEDLAGHRFAFTDELSLSGHAWPVHAVKQAGLDPRRFFAAAYFTHSHDRSIEAVERGFVDGASVDSNILLDMIAAAPELERRVRVVHRSPPLGIPPVVALESFDEQTRERVREALRTLHLRPDGAKLLAPLGIERFVAPEPGLYDFARQVVAGSLP